MWVSLDIFSLLSISLPVSFPLSLRVPPHPTSPASSGPLCTPCLQPPQSTKATTPAWLCLADQFEGLSSSSCLGLAMSQTPHPQCGLRSWSAADGAAGGAEVRGGRAAEASLPETALGRLWGDLGGGSEGPLCSRFHVTECWHLIFQIHPVVLKMLPEEQKEVCHHKSESK